MQLRKPSITFPTLFVHHPSPPDLVIAAYSPFSLTNFSSSPKTNPSDFESGFKFIFSTMISVSAGKVAAKRETFLSRVRLLFIDSIGRIEGFFRIFIKEYTLVDGVKPFKLVISKVNRINFIIQKNKCAQDPKFH